MPMSIGITAFGPPLNPLLNPANLLFIYPTNRGKGSRKIPDPLLRLADPRARPRGGGGGGAQGAVALLCKVVGVYRSRGRGHQILEL